VEEQTWLVNGDRSPLARIGLSPIRDLATAEPQMEWNESTALAKGPALKIKTNHTGGDCRRQEGPQIVSGHVSRASMRGWLRPQFFNLVLECQLASLEIHDFEVVHRRVVHRVIDFTFDVAVFPLQLIKMGSKRHDWFSLSWFPRLQPSKARPPQVRFCDGTMTLCHHPTSMSNAAW
jgi:hypothetical protein